MANNSSESNDSKKILLYAHSKCGFCQKLENEIEKNAAEIKALNIEVERIACDVHPEVCESAGVTGFPHLVNKCDQIQPGYVNQDKFVKFANCDQ